MAHDFYREERVEHDERVHDVPTTVVERDEVVLPPRRVPPVVTEPAVVEPRVYRPFGHQVNRVIWYLFGLLEGLLALRVILHAIGANPDNAFAAFIAAVTAPFVAPFRTLVADPRYDGAVFEVTTLVAMVVYVLLAYAITRLIHIMSDRAYDV